MVSPHSGGHEDIELALSLPKLPHTHIPGAILAIVCYENSLISIGIADARSRAVVELHPGTLLYASITQALLQDLLHHAHQLVRPKHDGDKALDVLQQYTSTVEVGGEVVLT